MKINLIKQKNVPKSYHVGNVIYFYRDDVVAIVSEIGDEFALINLENGKLYGLSDTLNGLFIQTSDDPGELINAELREVRSNG
ncbi:hypothetical protein HC026_12140 [Lactobacillus sp. LC28-10]|uniref:Uncharacterized protein n=1 Tax=Secundilactobacillus angelensis TaxID=2722706 RepID=A0ABX1L098_9LACO|nr:hypothetical protein [Secundilactobacillus angelensis]MCH5463513.1 hypothetical protein [Secundilactobacillus angelensis]NLR19637.1 hypothetical protein [Secundilactobacillus angelensis]